MRYFVIHPDGSRYGPVDLPTLNQWAAEGRILGSTYLEEEIGGRRILAVSLRGLNLPGQPNLGSMAQSPFPNPPSAPSAPYGGSMGANPHGGPQAGLGGGLGQNPQYPQYPKQGYAQYPHYMPVDDGSTDIKWSYCFTFASGLGCCCPLLAFSAIGGIYYAHSAGKKGHRGATLAMIFAIVSLITAFVLPLFANAFFGGLGNLIK